MTGAFRRAIDTALAREQQSTGRVRRRVRWLLYVARLALQVVRQWVRDRCPQQAASLAFQTAMSLVPLIAIGLMLLRATGAFAEESTLVEYISKQVIPVSQEEISAQLVAWAGRLSFKTAGVAGIVMTLVLSYVMFNSVERIFNDIWKVEKRRRFGTKFVIFYAVATITPLLLGVSLYHAARYGLTRGWVGFLGALGATWAALFFANKLLPATRVKWSAAALGALLSAIAFELAKLLFQLYVSEVAFRKYSGVYGALGLIPILLLWIYYSWLVVLLGAEVAHATQHLGHLERAERSAREPLSQVNGRTGARAFLSVVSAWRRGAPPVTRSVAAEELDLVDDAVDRIFTRLAEAGLVVETEDEGFVPARPPDQVTLADVLAVFRAADVSSTETRTGDRLDDLLADVEGAARERARNVTFDELVEKATGSSLQAPGPDQVA